MTDNIKKESSVLSTRIRKLRDEKGLTQVQLAEILNTSKQSIWNYESGYREPNLETLLQIAKYFKVSTDYLLGNTEFKNYTLEAMNNRYNRLLPFIGEDLAKNLRLFPNKELKFLNLLFTSDSFHKLISYFFNYKQIRNNEDFLKFSNLRSLGDMTLEEGKKFTFKILISKAIEDLLEELNHMTKEE